MGTTRRVLVVLGSLVLSSTLGTAAMTATAATAAQPQPGQGSVLTGIRTGAHPTFDRVVLDFTGPAPRVGWRFVPELVQDGSGQVEQLDGTVFAEVHTSPARAHHESGEPSYQQPRSFPTPHLGNVRGVAITGDFEGVVTVGVGMDRQAPMSVRALAGPTRVVIDIGLAAGAG